MNHHETPDDSHSAPTFDVTTGEGGKKIAMLSDPDNGQAWVTIDQSDLVTVEA